jgi:PIN domain nuclease of toxin-antitoxin system
MKYLLDTHIVLWLAENSSNLSDSAKTILLDETNEKYVSIASCWEVSIKLSLKKLELEGGTNEFFRIMQENGFWLLQVTAEQLTVLENLPFYHRDPFDRLLIATAISEDMIFLTADTQMIAYANEKLKIVS